jgi:hypothetical protein
MFGAHRRKLSTKVGLLAAVVGATGAWSVPMAVADGGAPQGGGGCHMVSSPSSTGLDHMMAGSSNGSGAANMVEMLSRFSPEPFCGP